jgi:hypothetical protein
MCLSVFGQDQDSQHRKLKTPLRNPYRNIKSSIFAHSGYSEVLGRNYSVGFEVRRFISLKEYLYLSAAFSRWTNNQDRIKNDVYQACSYYLNSQTLTLRAGLGIFGNNNAMIGFHYLMEADLKERVPSALDPESNVVLNGNISGYARDFIPFIGYNLKYKLWQIIFIEVGVEYWLIQNKIFQPLEGNWRVPDNTSPLLSDDYQNYPYGYIAFHFKL